MQYSLNKDLQHHKWQQQKSWISYPDYQGAQDKQQTQYRLIPKWKWKMLTNYWNFQNRSVQTFGFVYHDTNGLNHGPVWETQSFLLNEICVVTLWQDCCGRGNLRKSYWSTVGKRFPNWECLFVHRENGLFLSVYVDDIKNWLERNTSLIRCGKYSTKKSIWENQHLSWIMYTWDALKDNVKWAKDIVDNYRTMFESRISAVRVEKLPFTQKLRISSWSYDMAGHAKKCVERYCELANKTTQQLYKVSTPCIDDHHFKEEELKSVGELSNTCSQIVLKCSHFISWSVNKFVRSITKWTKACDKRISRLISYIHHTCEYRHYCHVGNTVKQCRLGLFQDSDFARDLEDSKSTSGGTLCIFGSHTLVPISWMCKKQTWVSHSSTESEIISLDTGLRLDGLLALELWDLIVSVLGNVSHISDRTGQLVNGKNKSHNKIDVVQDIDSVPSNVQQGDLLMNKREVRSPPHTIQKHK